jgi:hypothetical protein
MKRLLLVGIALLALAGCGGGDDNEGDSAAAGGDTTPATTTQKLEGTPTPAKVAAALGLTEQGSGYKSPGGCNIKDVAVGKADAAAARDKYSNGAVLSSDKQIAIVLDKVTIKCAVEAKLGLAGLK